MVRTPSAKQKFYRCTACLFCHILCLDFLFSMGDNFPDGHEKMQRIDKSHKKPHKNEVIFQEYYVEIAICL